MQHDATLQEQIETVEARLAALVRKAETGEQWAEIALIEARDLVPLQRRLTQHDRHVWDRTTFLFDRIVAELFSPAEFGWNEWSRYAASGEWF